MTHNYPGHSYRIIQYKTVPRLRTLYASVGLCLFQSQPAYSPLLHLLEARRTISRVVYHPHQRGIPMGFTPWSDRSLSSLSDRQWRATADNTSRVGGLLISVVSSGLRRRHFIAAAAAAAATLSDTMLW